MSARPFACSSRVRRLLALGAAEARPWLERAGAWTDLCGPTEGLRTVARVSFAGRPCYQLEALTQEGAVQTHFFDVETGLLSGSICSEEVHPIALLTFTRVFTDYRKFGELLFPSKVTSYFQGPEVVFTRTVIEFDQVDPRAFRLPIAIDAISQGKIEASAR